MGGISRIPLIRMTPRMDSSGPRNPGAGANGGSFNPLHPSPASMNWTNPGNIVSKGNGEATVAADPTGYESRYLNGSAFGFAIPSDATIKGFIVEVKRWATSDGAGDPVVYHDGIRLLKNGVRQPIKSDGAGDLYSDDPYSDYVSYGSPIDLWGVATPWTPALVNQSNFGVSIWATPAPDSLDDGISTAHIDHMRVTCFFQRA